MSIKAAVSVAYVGTTTENWFQSDFVLGLALAVALTIKVKFSFSRDKEGTTCVPLTYHQAAHQVKPGCQPVYRQRGEGQPSPSSPGYRQQSPGEGEGSVGCMVVLLLSDKDVVLTCPSSANTLAFMIGEFLVPSRVNFNRLCVLCAFQEPVI